MANFPEVQTMQRIHYRVETVGRSVTVPKLTEKQNVFYFSTQKFRSVTSLLHKS